MAEKPPELQVPRPDRDHASRRDGHGPGLAPAPARERDLQARGLDAQQLRWRPAPTANSLGVIVVHLGYAERLWFRAIAAGEPMDMAWRATMFELPAGWGVEEVIAFYRGECALADAALDRVPSLDLPSRADFRPTTWRWAMFHMIEETARHAGHMDITRELLDGRTGR